MKFLEKFNEIRYVKYLAHRRGLEKYIPFNKPKVLLWVQKYKYK